MSAGVQNFKNMTGGQRKWKKSIENVPNLACFPPPPPISFVATDF